MELYIAYTLGSIVGMVIFALILRSVLKISTIISNQNKIIEALAAIGSSNRENSYPSTKEITYSEDAEKNSMIATEIANLKRRYRQGNLTEIEYKAEMDKLAN